MQDDQEGWAQVRVGTGQGGDEAMHKLCDEIGSFWSKQLDMKYSISFILPTMRY